MKLKNIVLFYFFFVCNGLVIPELLKDSYKKPLLNNRKVEGIDEHETNFQKLVIHENSIPHEYIIIFKNDADDSSINAYFSFLKTYQIKYDNTNKLKENEDFAIDRFLRGHILKTNIDYKLIPLLLEIPIIQVIETNSVIQLNSLLVQNDTSWGLARICQENRLKILDEQNYYYNSDGQGENVDVYILDTGISTSHVQFDKRATWGKTVLTNAPDRDNNGHGTHCAGVIGSQDYGVAKKVKLIAVKILDSKGDGLMSDLIKGIEYVAQEHLNSTENKPEFKGSVINLSVGAGKSIALNLTIHAVVNSGVNVVVAAGNEDEDACSSSPADSKDAITVGATTFSDYRAFFSNWGNCVDIFAPGTNIMSTWIGSNNNETKSLSGTSMSTPFVAGLTAYVLSLYPEKGSQFHFNDMYKNGNHLITPFVLKEKLMRLATNGVLNDIPENTPNLMAYNGRGKPLPID